MSDKPFTFEEFRSIYSRVPRLCVDLIIQTPEGVLLTLRDIPPNKGMWHLPGGTLLFREKIEDAVQRVAKNELGIEVEIKEYIGFMQFLRQDNFEGFDHPVSLGILCTTKNTDFVLNDQASDVQFFKRMPDTLMQEQKEFIEKKITF